MGCCFSCRQSATFDCVRLIHINGYIADFEAPVTVAEVTGKLRRHVLCTSAHLLTFGSATHLRPDDALEAGHLYFLLPQSVFESDASLADLTSLAARLTAIATAVPGRVNSKSAQKRGLVEPIGPKNRTHGGAKCSRARAWRPDLSPIHERSEWW